jgi:hypothetical protein
MLIGKDLARALDPVIFARECGIEPDSWQADLMRDRPPKALLCCSRQSGKTTTTGVIALEEACHTPGSLVLIGAPAQRQSGEMLHTIKRLHARLDDAPSFLSESVLKVEFENGSRIVALSGDPKTSRGYAAPALVIVDECAYADDELIQSLRAMQATVSKPRVLALSTPNGRRGYFFEQWHHGEGWKKISVAAKDCPRISKEYLAEQLKEMGPTRYAQEFELAFLDNDEAAFNTAIIDAAFTSEFRALWI